MMMDIFN